MVLICIFGICLLIVVACAAGKETLNALNKIRDKSLYKEWENWVSIILYLILTCSAFVGCIGGVVVASMHVYGKTIKVCGLYCQSPHTINTLYNNGQIKETYSVIKNSSGSFIKQGKYECWYFNGMKEAEIYYDHNKPITLKRWSANGVLLPNKYLPEDFIPDTISK